MSDEEVSLDDISLSEGELAELERQLEEEEAMMDEVEEDDELEEEELEEGEEEAIVDELEELEEDESDELDELDELGEEDAKLERSGSGSVPLKLDSPCIVSENIESELDDMGDGISEVQFAAKLRMRLKDEMMEQYQLQKTLTYITNKYEGLEKMEGQGSSGIQAEIDDCNERIQDYKSMLQEEKQENDKMYEAILKLRAAQESVTVDLTAAKKEYLLCEKQRQQSVHDLAFRIQTETKEFVDCKRDQNEVITTLQASLEKANLQNSESKQQSQEIQQDIDELEKTISSHLQKKASILEKQQEAGEDHYISKQKIQSKITRQQRQYEITKSEDERRQKDIDEQTLKLAALKEEHERMLKEMEDFARDAKKKQRTIERQKQQIKALDSDKEEARRKLRETERKLRMKRY